MNVLVPGQREFKVSFIITINSVHFKSLDLVGLTQIKTYLKMSLLLRAHLLLGPSTCLRHRCFGGWGIGEMGGGGGRGRGRWLHPAATPMRGPVIARTLDHIYLQFTPSVLISELEGIAFPGQRKRANRRGLGRWRGGQINGGRETRPEPSV